MNSRLLLPQRLRQKIKLSQRRSRGQQKRHGDCQNFFHAALFSLLNGMNCVPPEPPGTECSRRAYGLWFIL